jgi:hypothetical protein
MTVSGDVYVCYMVLILQLKNCTISKITNNATKTNLKKRNDLKKYLYCILASKLYHFIVLVKRSVTLIFVHDLILD